MDSRIFFATAMESVMTVMSWMLSISIAEVRPVRIAMSSALIDVMFNEWTRSCLITELSAQMCAAAVVTWDFLTSLSAMTAMLLRLT